MKYTQAFGYSTVLQFVSEAMSTDFLPVHDENPVLESSGSMPAGPLPAIPKVGNVCRDRAVLVYPLPEFRNQVSAATVLAHLFDGFFGVFHRDCRAWRASSTCARMSS